MTVMVYRPPEPKLDAYGFRIAALPFEYFDIVLKDAIAEELISIEDLHHFLTKPGLRRCISRKMMGTRFIRECGSSDFGYFDVIGPEDEIRELLAKTIADLEILKILE